MIELIGFLIALIIAPFIAWGLCLLLSIPLGIFLWIDENIGRLFSRKEKRNHYSVKLLDDEDLFRKYEEEYVRRKENGHQN